VSSKPGSWAAALGSEEQLHTASLHAPSSPPPTPTVSAPPGALCRDEPPESRPKGLDVDALDSRRLSEEICEAIALLPQGERWAIILRFALRGELQSYPGAGRR
jgi:hypothetical protein